MIKVHFGHLFMQIYFDSAESILSFTQKVVSMSNKAPTDPVRPIQWTVSQFCYKTYKIVYLSRHTGTTLGSAFNSCARRMYIQYAKSLEHLKLDQHKITARMVIFSCKL